MSDTTKKQSLFASCLWILALVGGLNSVHAVDLGSASWGGCNNNSFSPTPISRLGVPGDIFAINSSNSYGCGYFTSVNSSVAAVSSASLYPGGSITVTLGSGKGMTTIRGPGNKPWITVTNMGSSQSDLIEMADPSSITVGGTTTLSTMGGSGTGVVTHSLQSGSCSISGSILTGVGAGSCMVTATKSADNSYGAITSSPLAVMVGLASQSALNLMVTPSMITVGGVTTLSTMGGSGSGAVTYSVQSGSCSITGTSLMATGSGICSVTATKAGDTTYGAITSSPVSVMVGLAPQSALTLITSPSMITVGAASSLSTLGGSGMGAVTYAVVSGPCSVNASMLSGTAKGTCLVEATKMGDTNYAPVTSASVSIPVEVMSQSALVLSSSATSITVGETANLSTTGGTGSGRVSYSVSSGPCSISGSTLTGILPGVCAVTASKAGDARTAMVMSTPQTIIVGLRSQGTLSILANPQVINVGASSTLSVTGGAGSGAVGFSLLSGPCMVSGNTVTGLALGTCALSAIKAGDSQYASITAPAFSLNVGMGVQPALNISVSPLSFPVGTSAAITTNGGSGNGAVSLNLLSGPCSVNGASLLGLASGTCLVQAIKASDGVVAQSTSLPVSVEITPSATPVKNNLISVMPVTNIKAKVGAKAVRISWKKPKTGRDIKQFVVNTMPSQASCQTKRTSCSIAGLMHGHSYSFIVSTQYADGTASLAAPVGLIFIP